MVRTLKRFVSSALVALLLLDWPMISAYAEHAKSDREWRVEKMRQLRAWTRYSDIADKVRVSDLAKKDAAVRAAKKAVRAWSATKLRFRSSESLDAVWERMSGYDASAEVKKLFGDSYEITVPDGSDFATEFLPQASEGKLPETLPGGFSVVLPAPVEASSSSGFLAGERTDDLWWQAFVRADSVQESLAGLPETRIGVIDSGVDASHPDLAWRVDAADGYDFVENDSDPQDANGHGTFVAGIVAGAVNGSGIYGVDSNAKIVPLRVLDADGMGTTYALADAISYAASKGVKVLNVSLGGYGDPATDPVCQAVSAAKAAGTVVVAAAGNSNSDVSNVVPAWCADAIAVGAVGKDGSKAPFSNFGSKIAVSAPGVGILSSKMGGGFETRDGTSASAAFVAGAVGAMLAKDPSVTSDEIRNGFWPMGGALRMDSILSLEPPSPAPIPSAGGTEQAVGSDFVSLSGASFSEAPLSPIDQWPFYVGTFLSDGIWYGNGFFPGKSFSRDILDSYGVKVFSGAVSIGDGNVRAMSVPPSGLAAEYRFNGNANETYGLANDGIVTSAVLVADRFGRSNSAYDFHNCANVRIPYSPSLAGSDNMTISVWVKTDSWSTGEQTVVVKNRDSNPNTYFLRLSNGRVVFVVRDAYESNPAPGMMYTDDVVNDGNWHLVTGRVTGKNVQIFIDGTLRVAHNGPPDFGSQISNPVYWTSNAGDVSIGYQNFPPWEYCFQGAIDDVSYYDRALSDDQIRSMFSKDGLVWEWLLNGNANDTSGNWNDGIASSLSWTSDGASRQAGVFNGLDSNISFGNSSPFSLSNGSMSVSVWYNLNDGQPNPGWGIGKWGYINGGWEFLFSSAENVAFYVGGTQLYATHALGLGKWIHAVGTFDNVTKKRSIYINGKLYASDTYNTAISDTPYPFVIWYRSGTDWYKTHVNGSMKGVRIYNRAISENEVAHLYEEYSNTVNASSTRPSPQISGLDLSAYAGSTSSVTKFNDALRSGNFKTSAEADASRHDSTNAWDPVTLSTGEFAYSNTFLKAKEGPMPYEFSVTYRNQMKYAGPVGNGFDHNYNVFLVENADGSVSYYDGHLGIFAFAPAEGGGFVRNDGLRAALAKDVAGHYSIAFDGGARREFWPNLRMSKDSDKYGNSLAFAYYSNDALATVTDPLGRTVAYDYGADTRLSKVTDWLGRTVEFSYFPGGDLKSATLKSWTASKAVSFTYVGSTHNIATLVDAKGQTYVTNAYDANGRVTSQTYGNGTINYSYELSGSRVASNTVTNAEGVVTKYSYDSNGNVTERRVYDRTGGGSTAYRYEYYPDARLAKSVMPNGNGTTYLYDSRGNVLEKRDKTNADAPDSPDDLVTYAEYDPTYGIPVRSVSPDGVETVAALDGSGGVLSRTTTGILNPDGTKYSSTVSYGYDSLGMLAKTSDPLGRETSYAYSGWLLASVTKGTGTGSVTESVSYGADGNPVSSTDAGGNAKTFEYDALGQLAKTVSSEGVQTLYGYDANGNRISEETRSSTGLVVARTDYAYDALDKVTSKTVSTGGGASVTALTAYDSNGNVVSEKVGNGAEVRTAYDEMGRVKEKRIITDPNDASKDAVTRYSYDRNGNLLSVTDPLGNAASYAYDGFDRKIRATDPLGNIATYAYDKAGNAVETRTYSSAQVLISRTLAAYDGAGRIIKTTKKGNGTVPDAVSTVRYAPDGNVVETVDPMGNATAYSYDALGRKASVTDALGNRAETSYDARGLVTETRLVGSGSEIAVTTRYAYDADGRKTAEKSVTSTGTFDTAYSYGALPAPLSVTDADGNRTDFAYDLAGRKVSETRYLADGTPVAVSYSYDGNGNLAAVTDAEGKTTAYSYDPLGRNVRVTYPDGTHKDFSYDKLGNRVGETLARSVSVSTSYDALGRPTLREATGSGIPVPESETYSYDALGRLVSASSSGSSLAFSYDFFGRMSSETQDGKTVGYSYDRNGNRLSVTASGYVAEYSRDALGRMTSASLDGTGIVDRSYSGTFLASDSFRNGARTDYSYDALGRLAELSRPGLPSASRGYAYSPAGNVLSDGLRNYSYDPLSRLVSAAVLPDAAHPAGAEEFGYDKADNRLTSGSAGTSAAYSGNLLDQYVSKTSGSGAESYSYDADGNLASDGKRLFSYDSKNRLVSVKAPDGTPVASYSYDPLGRRTSKITNEGKTDYLYAGDNAVTETFSPKNGGTPAETSNLFGDSPDELLAYSSDVSAVSPAEAGERLFCALRVAPYGNDFARYGWNALVLRCAGLETLAGTVERKTFAVLSDRLGSPVALIGQDGTTALGYAYSAFGEAYAKSGTGNFVPLRETGPLLGDSRLFAGREYDAETGLYYVRARTYSPELGRFLQRDPVWQSDQVNPYTYVANNPLGYTDPSGKIIANLVGWVVSVAMGIGIAEVESYVTGEELDYSWTDAWVDFAAGFIWAGLFSKTEKLGEMALLGNKFAWKSAMFLTRGAWEIGLGIVGEAVKTDCPKGAILPKNVGENILAYAVASAVGHWVGKLFQKSVKVLWWAYRNVRDANIWGEVHHMPADSVTTFSRDSWPSIWMETIDHKKTASWWRGWADYRKAQENLINQGHIMDAINMDVQDIRSKFWDKYDQGINQMLDYYNANLR